MSQIPKPEHPQLGSKNTLKPRWGRRIDAKSREGNLE